MLGLAHHVDLQAGHVAEGHGAPEQYGGQCQPGVARGEGKGQKHDSQQCEDQLERTDRPAAVGQLAAPDVAYCHGNPVDQQHQAHRAFTKAADLLQDGREKGERDKGAAVADCRHRIDQKQARLFQNGQLLDERSGFAVLDAARHEEQAADKGDHAEQRHGQKGLPPTELLTDEGAEWYAGHQRDGEPSEHDGDGARGFLFRDQAGGDGRADGEEHAVGETGDDARQDQRFVARRLPGQQVAGGEQHHQRQQQQLARDLAGQRREQRCADRDAQGVKTDQQPG